jgi:hypothetical protein
VDHHHLWLPLGALLLVNSGTRRIIMDTLRQVGVSLGVVLFMMSARHR